MLIHGHPTGNQFFLNAALAFHELGLLEECFTCIASCRGNLWGRLARVPGLKEIGRRSMPEELSGYLKLHPSREMMRLMLNRVGMYSWVRPVNAPFSVDQVYWSLDRQMARAICRHSRRGAKSGIIYAYEDGALSCFQQARELGWSTVYDLPIAYWSTSQRLLQEEAERYPQWAPTLLGESMPEEKKQRKTRELELADHIICPSSFVERSLPDTIPSRDKVHVIPFGTPQIDLSENFERQEDRVFKLLFVGGLTQRKGLADLFQAMHLLKGKAVELHVVGELLMPLKFYRQSFPDFVYHTSRDHGSLLRLMQQCDALVLPSIVEGRAQVQQEAMACGLPIIVTANAGAEDLVEEGVTGVLVPVRSPEKIAEAIDGLAGMTRASMREMRKACIDKVIPLSWERYRVSLQRVIRMIQSATD